MLLLGKVFTLGTLLLLSGMLALDAFGAFMYARGMVLFLGPFMALGLTVTAMRRIPPYIDAGDYGRAKGFIRTIFWVALTVASVTALVLVFGAPQALEPDLATPLRIAILALPAFALMTALMQVARAAGRVRLAYAPLNVGQPLAFALCAFAAVLVFDVADANTLAAILAITMCASALIQAWNVLRLDMLRPAKIVSDATLWLREAVPLTLSLAAQGLTAFGPLLILGLFVQGGEIGIFGFYQTVMQGLLVFNTSIFGAVNPKLSVAISRNDRPTALGLLRKWRLVAFGISAVGGVVAWLLVIYFGDLIQPAFSTEGLALSLLLSSVAINGLSGPLGHVLIIEGRSHWEITSQVGAALLTACLAFLLIPTWSLTGAAFATATGAAVRAIAVHSLVYLKLNYAKVAPGGPDA
ncbi:MAG: oligosaccharide flippase family protein [Pseudomonadota bacterium]